MLVKVTGSIVALPEAGTSGGATSEIDLSMRGPGQLFEDVRQREQWRLHTNGPLGQHFVELDVPSTVVQLYLASRDQSEIAVRCNGAPAIVTGGTPFDPTALVVGDRFTVAIDDGPLVVVEFGSDDRGWGPALGRINGLVGHPVARRTADDRLELVGRNSGDRDARDAGWQHGTIEVGGMPATLDKLGLAAGVAYGKGTDVVVKQRFLFEPPTSGAHAVRRVELSGSADLVTHVAGY